jgi:hypothetical protein
MNIIYQLPSNPLVPGQCQEIDNSLAGAQGDIKKALVIGCCLSDCRTAGVPAQVMSAQKAGELFGYGSPVAVMADTFLAINKAEELLNSSVRSTHERSFPPSNFVLCVQLKRNNISGIRIICAKNFVMGFSPGFEGFLPPKTGIFGPFFPV